MTNLAKLFLILMTGAPASAFGNMMAKSSSWKLPRSLMSTNHLRTIHASQTDFPPRRPNTSLDLSKVANFPRGGSIVDIASSWNSSPKSLFNTSLMSLAVVTTIFKLLQQIRTVDNQTTEATKSKTTRSLQIRFLSVFWLLRCADWLQGPYFYEVYASKVVNGMPASLTLVSQLFLTGFASTALFGPLIGSALDTYGRKKGTLAFAVLYALGAASTKSPLLQVLFLGRVLCGIGTSLLFSAPESWLVGESQQCGDDPDGTRLSETFGLAYAGDSIVAIMAGQLAGVAAARRGPTGPFELSIGFLALGATLTAILWKENYAKQGPTQGTNSSKAPSIKDAIQVIRNDSKIMLVGGVQSLFEAAMYIFVLQWPPAMRRAIEGAHGANAATPYGTIFSCFMACCLLGSTLFGQLARMSVPTEGFTALMLSIATVAMSSAAFTVSSSMNLASLVASFFVFEMCVGMYFPSIGTLRSKYVPDFHRSIIMNLFGIPLNVLVVSVFLSISKLGLEGALGISAGSLGLATLCMMVLSRQV